MRFECWSSCKPGSARGQRGAHADRFIAPAQSVSGPWPETSGGVGHECVSIFRDLNPTRWRQLNQIPSHCSRDSAGEIERRATELSLHGRINYVYRRQQEYLQAGRTWGAEHAGVLRPVPWPTFPPSSDCTSRCRFIPAAWAFSPATTSRAHRTSTYPLSHWLVLWQGYFLQRLDQSGWQCEEYCRPISTNVPCSLHRTKWRAVAVEIETRGGSIRAKVWRIKVGRCDLLLLDSNVEATLRKTAN